MLRNFFKLFFKRSILFILLTATPLWSQWINNSKLHTQLVFDSVDPVNIRSVEDGNGGAFLFWQDKKSKTFTDVLFLHFDNNGNVSFRADGKSISASVGEKKNPITAGNNSQTAVVLWNDFSSNNAILYGQLVASNGMLLWGENGLKISDGQRTLVNCNVAIDSKNTSYITYIEKNDAAPTEYFLKLQIISAAGTPKYLNAGLLINKSLYAKNNSMVFPDEKGGCFVLSGENENKIYQIHAQYIDERGKILWRETSDISGHSTSITGYHALLAKPGLLYVYWQNLGKNKSISHQLLTAGGKTLLDERHVSIIKQNGNQGNPQAVLTGDSTIMLSWVNDFNGKKNIYVQKFKTNGAALWNAEPLRIAKTGDDQFGQAIIADDRGGAVLAWLNQKNQAEKPSVFAQKISAKKELLWNESGTPIASDKNSDKSYLSLFSDQKGGVIILFKELNKEKSGIFGQRLFGAESLVSQVTDFSAKVISDSVQLTWTVTNEADLFSYKIEKMNREDAVDNVWRPVASLLTTDVSKTNKYEITEPLDDAGIVYFRLSQFGRDGKKYFSAVEKITFAPVNADENYVVQNSPNPFSGKTTIVFNLIRAQDVKLEIFNSRVEKVKDILITDTQSGKNKFLYDGTALPAGIYFYRFTAGDFVDVKKMVVTK